MSIFLVTVCLVLVYAVTVNAFRLSSRVPTTSSLKMMDLDSMSTMATSYLINVPQEQAQKEFFFFFFAGSGALGIGAAQIPTLIRIQEKLSSLAGGNTKGGEELSGAFTLGFPEPLRIADVEEVIQKTDISAVVNAGPKRGYMAQQGMMERAGMMKSLVEDQGCNPLAAYAVYECFSKGGGELASPIVASEMLEAWREEGNLEGFKSGLTKATTAKYSAYAVFAFLNFVIIDLIIESYSQGFPNGFQIPDFSALLS